MKYCDFKFPKKLNVVKNNVNYTATSKTGYLVIDYPDADNDIYVSTADYYYHGLFYGNSEYCKRTREDYYDLVRFIDEIL